MSDLKATIRASDDAIRKMVIDATLAGEEEYEHCHLTIMDGEVNVLAAGSGSALSYSTFREGAGIHSIELADAVRDLAGEEKTPLTEALLDIDVFLRYYNLISETDQPIRLEFYGGVDDLLANYVEMYGDLNAKLHLPASDPIRDKMPLSAPQKFDADDVWDGKRRLDTEIHTTTEKVQRIIDAVDADDISSIDNYPIVVEDGKFKVDVTDGQQRNWISGVLDDETTTVTGGDVANLYGEGFKRVFDSLDGEVRIQTTAGDDDGRAPPVAVVKEDADGVIRHVVGGVGTL